MNVFYLIASIVITIFIFKSYKKLLIYDVVEGWLLIFLLILCALVDMYLIGELLGQVH